MVQKSTDYITTAKFEMNFQAMTDSSAVNKSRTKWIVLILGLICVFALAAILALVHLKQDEIIQSQIESLNREHKGLISIADIHLAPFKNFPYISLKVDSVRVMESKPTDSPIILDVADIYVGFNLLDIAAGNFDIQTLLIEDGFFNIVFHEDGTTNIQNALATPNDVETSDPPNIHLKSIKLVNLDIHKQNESTDTDIETFIYVADGGFESDNGVINAHIDTEFELNVMQAGDTTFINHKHFEFHTDLSFDELSGLLQFEPSGITLEHADFDLEGSIDTKNDMDLDLSVKGTKSNFDMLIAFAPNDLIPVLERYENAGNIYLNAIIQGPSINGKLPFFDVHFGASEAFLENVMQGRRIDNLGFQGHFTNGKERHMRTTEFSLTEMTASMESGNVYGSVVVKNFEEPDVDMRIKTDFELEWLDEFLQLEEIDNATGRVSTDIRFHDIVDIEHPELALTELNQAYFMELILEDLKFESKLLPAPIESLNAHLIMKGKKADLDLFELKAGNSDISITGYLSDLPAVVHHTNKPVTAHLDFHADYIDLAELTSFSEADSTGIDEQLEDFSVGLSFKSSARAFTESEFLPLGEFFIDSFHTRLKHYPHQLHDFRADIIIDSTDMRIVDFTGEIDDSDLLVDGLIHDFGFWFQPELEGDVDLDLTFESKLLRLEDVFTYKGENYVPEDYRHEEFENLIVHANTSMHYRASKLHSIDIDLDKLGAKMHVHPLRFENFYGRIHYEDDHIMVERFRGKLGKTEFDLDANYYLGDDEAIKKRDNHLGLKAYYIDIDELTNFNPPPAKVDTAEDSLEDVEEHAEAFNLYELPFTNMTVDVDIDRFIYHGLDIQDIHARLRTTKDHYLYVDTIDLKTAGGTINMSGYFNGSDPSHIYLKPKLSIRNVDIDKLMFKYESMGHDVELSKNLHGSLSADINGNIRVYPDMVPDLDQSEIHLDVEVLDGRLVNYEPMRLLSDYMGDKDLTNIRFDTITNHIDLTQGILSIPSMNVESTLGHYELSGKHDLDHKLEYYVRIPWKTIREGARSKLFGTKKEEEVSNDIIERDPNKPVKYLNLKIHGTLDNFKVGLGKDKRIQ